jgi:hypothetical protein
MRDDRAWRLLFIAAALAAGASAPAHAAGRVVWVEMCDALHPGRKVPLPPIATIARRGRPAMPPAASCRGAAASAVTDGFRDPA